MVQAESQDLPTIDVVNDEIRHGQQVPPLALGAAYTLANLTRFQGMASPLHVAAASFT